MHHLLLHLCASCYHHFCLHQWVPPLDDVIVESSLMIDNVVYICYAVTSLLFYPYLSSCTTVTAAAEPEYTECLGQSSGSCEDLVRENCALGGNILWLSDAVRDASHCQVELQTKVNKQRISHFALQGPFPVLKTPTTTTLSYLRHNAK